MTASVASQRDPSPPSAEELTGDVPVKPSRPAAEEQSAADRQEEARPIGSVRAVVFDVDGTLYPFFRAVVPSLPLVARHPRLFRAFGRARHELRHARPDRNIKQHQAQLVAARLGVSEAAAQRLIERLIYHEWPAAFSRLRPFPHVAATLAALRRRGLKLGVLSDSPLVEDKLRALGLDSHWDHAVAAEDSGQLKPNPEPFHYVADLLGVPPEQTLFVGNSYPYDIVGAHRVGMASAHFARRPVAFGVATYTFSNYRSFPEIPP